MVVLTVERAVLVELVALEQVCERVEGSLLLHRVWQSAGTTQQQLRGAGVQGRAPHAHETLHTTQYIIIFKNLVVCEVDLRAIILCDNTI